MERGGIRSVIRVSMDVLVEIQGRVVMPHTGNEAFAGLLSAIADVCKAWQDANLERIKNPRLATRRPDNRGGLTTVD